MISIRKLPALKDLDHSSRNQWCTVRPMCSEKLCHWNEDVAAVWLGPRPFQMTAWMGWVLNWGPSRGSCCGIGAVLWSPKIYRPSLEHALQLTELLNYCNFFRCTTGSDVYVVRTYIRRQMATVPLLYRIAVNVGLLIQQPSSYNMPVYKNRLVVGGTHQQVSAHAVS